MSNISKDLGNGDNLPNIEINLEATPLVIDLAFFEKEGSKGIRREKMFKISMRKNERV
jgi:hypothetical protein